MRQMEFHHYECHKTLLIAGGGELHLAQNRAVSSGKEGSCEMLKRWAFRKQRLLSWPTIKWKTIMRIFFFFFCCERGVCFAEKSTYEVAQGDICLRMRCTARKSNGSSQQKPPKASISSRGEGRKQGAFDFDEAEDACTMCFLKGNEGLYSINVELNCLSTSTEAHTATVNEYIS